MTDYDPTGRERSWDKNRQKILNFHVEWSTGGVTGGSCYGGENCSFSSDNPPEDLTALDKVLEALDPNISFLRYKRLSGEVIENYTRSVNEYYGNHTNYSGKICRLDKLLRVLKEEKLWPIKDQQ